MVRLILLTDFTEGFAHYLLKGILNYSKGREPWVVCKMPPSYKQRFGLSGVLEWAKRWKANAIIAQFDDFDQVEIFKQNGIVAIAQDFKSRFTSIPNITADYHLTGGLAAEYFLEKGFQNFAFYGYKDVVWSAERCEGFKARIEKAGSKTFQDYQHQALEDLWFYETDALCNWLQELPKPVALMACDDNQGNRITEACKICNIKIPEEVAVLGVDNDELTCNLSDPSLSSIDMNIEQAGYETAKLLEKLLTTHRYTCKDVIIHPKRIISRESTNVYATHDPYILTALKYIHQHIESKLNVNDIVKIVPLSRRLLEIRFKEATGQGVYKYIFNLRMELFAQRLLETNEPVAEIALKIGLSDFRNLSRQFRSLKGCTPLEYRKRMQKAPTVIQDPF